MGSQSVTYDLAHKPILLILGVQHNDYVCVCVCVCASYIP